MLPTGRPGHVDSVDSAASDASGGGEKAPPEEGQEDASTLGLSFALPRERVVGSGCFIGPLSVVSSVVHLNGDRWNRAKDYFSQPWPGLLESTSVTPIWEGQFPGNTEAKSHHPAFRCQT